MSGQLGLWDIEERYALLSKAGDPLERLDVGVAWDVFAKPLAKALKRSDGPKGARPSSPPLMMFKILVLQARAINNLFARFDKHLQKNGYLAMGGQIVDAARMTERNCPIS